MPAADGNLAIVRSDDRGFLLGDGLFETILAQSGRLMFFHDHLARLGRGCAVLGLPAPDEGLAQRAAEAALEAADLAAGRAAVRLTWTAGSGGRGLDRPDRLEPRLFAAAAPAPAPGGPASLAVAAVRRNPQSPTSRLKTLAYLDNVVARRQAAAAGADEAIMLNVSGEVACAAAANLFWFDNDVLHTPALECGVLDGITRAQVLKLAMGLGVRTAESHASAGVLAAAEAVFLTSSLVGVRAACRLGERVLPPHAATAALADAWAALIGAG